LLSLNAASFDLDSAKASLPTEAGPFRFFDLIHKEAALRN
jgi:hypothetical protein